MSEDDADRPAVSATVELEGEYAEVAAILGEGSAMLAELGPAADDMEAVLEIVRRTGGATKSRVVDELPASVTADLDAESVIHVLRVLELYDLVVLDGNTWRPGPALPAE